MYPFCSYYQLYQMVRLIGTSTAFYLVIMSSKEELAPICPTCRKGKLNIRSMIYSVPFFNELAMFNMVCPECGFSHNDVFSAEQRKPSRFSIYVDDVSLLSVRIVRSGSGTYRFPEWGIDVEPGPAADSFITNVEGLLYRVRGVVETAANFSEVDSEKQRASEILNQMEDALNGEFPFTLILEDPAGVSGILPDDMTLVKYEELSPTEASKLKGAPFWIDTMREEYAESED
ncbi:ZPR1 zinc finger domain-containing protein [Candidatus Thorarchaeota archaeon]|nr:MAG: ZPR1 zinc finger domain-containing protein [Candidatus Thorarchaeota archaeon]